MSPPVSAACASPCIGICRLEDRSGLCEGCLRTLGEIAEWGQATEQRRRAILADVAKRRDERVRPAAQSFRRP